MWSPICVAARLLAWLVIAAPSGFGGSHVAKQGARQTDPLTGNWSGTSLCQVKNSSCRDENVVFHIRPGKGSGHYKVDADKIVNGQVIDMGELDFIYDRANHILSGSFPNGTWLLTVEKNHIDGTLTTPDKVLFRKLTLEKTGPLDKIGGHSLIFTFTK